MSLQPPELAILADHLDDHRYVLAFGYWRDFHPHRSLHRVGWVLCSLINGIASGSPCPWRVVQSGDKEKIEKVIRTLKARWSGGGEGPTKP